MTSAKRQDEFVARIAEHQAILRRVAGAWCRTVHDRDDLVQEMLAQLWRSYARFDGRAAFSTWMYRVALNVAISFQRRDRTRTKHVLPAAGEPLEVADARGEPRDDDALVQLRALIDELGDLDRALMLLYLDGRDHATIADILGLSTTNVGTKIGRLKQRLRDRFRIPGDDQTGASR